LSDVEGIISELEQQRAAIERALAALREIWGISDGSTTAPAKRRGRPPGRKFSAETRRRMSEAQQRRHGGKRAEEVAPEKATPATKQRGKKRNISPEGRARIADAARRMWATRKRAGKKLAAKKRG
jgi:hypothetical protein